MKRDWVALTAAVGLVTCLGASSAQAGPFSLKKSKKRIQKSGERYLLCLVSAELRKKKRLPIEAVSPEMAKAIPALAEAGVPWDLKVAGVSEDSDRDALLLTGAKVAMRAAVPALIGKGVIGTIAKRAVGQIPTGPDNEVEPDAFAELSVDSTLLLRTPKISGTTTPVWNHCAAFKRKNLLGRTIEIRVVDYDVLRLDPTAYMKGEHKARADVAGVVSGPRVTAEILDQIHDGQAVEQVLRSTGDENLRSVTWRIEAAPRSAKRPRKRR